MRSSFVFFSETTPRKSNMHNGVEDCPVRRPADTPALCSYVYAGHHLVRDPHVDREQSSSWNEDNLCQDGNKDRLDMASYRRHLTPAEPHFRLSGVTVHCNLVPRSRPLRLQLAHLRIGQVCPSTLASPSVTPLLSSVEPGMAWGFRVNVHFSATGLKARHTTVRS